MGLIEDCWIMSVSEILKSKMNVIHRRELFRLFNLALVTIEEWAFSGLALGYGFLELHFFGKLFTLLTSTSDLV